MINPEELKTMALSIELVQHLIYDDEFWLGDSEYSQEQKFDAFQLLEEIKDKIKLKVEESAVIKPSVWTKEGF